MRRSDCLRLDHTPHELLMSPVSGLQYKLYVSLGNCVVAADPPQKERLQLLNSVSPIFPPLSRCKLTVNSLSLSGVEDSVQTDRARGTCVPTQLLCGNQQKNFPVRHNSLISLSTGVYPVYSGLDGIRRQTLYCECHMTVM